MEFIPLRLICERAEVLFLFFYFFFEKYQGKKLAGFASVLSKSKSKVSRKKMATTNGIMSIKCFGVESRFLCSYRRDGGPEKVLD